MYTRDVRVFFNGQWTVVTVPCVPSTPMGELKKAAISILKRKQEKRVKKTLKLLEQGALSR
ncbi:hypothetical protein [Robertmurraya siralis]|uniref:hypothetical protein n=1 Tax=Robertmurraya siralis TaxID=77777 RepID=UPI0010FA07CB|nr:hypothetical protein [Robertmurraya siralis]